MTLSDLKARVRELLGRWEGYGWFNREVISFPSDNSYTPYPITDFDETNFGVLATENGGLRFFHE